MEIFFNFWQLPYSWIFATTLLLLSHKQSITNNYSSEAGIVPLLFIPLIASLIPFGFFYHWYSPFLLLVEIFIAGGILGYILASIFDAIKNAIGEVAYKVSTLIIVIVLEVFLWIFLFSI